MPPVDLIAALPTYTTAEDTRAYHSPAMRANNQTTIGSLYLDLGDRRPYNDKLRTIENIVEGTRTRSGKRI